MQIFRSWSADAQSAPSDVSKKVTELIVPNKPFWSSTAARYAYLAMGSLALAGVGAFIYGTRVETRRFGIDTIDVTTGGAPLIGNGNALPERTLKILHLSDLHLYGEDYEKAAFLRSVTDDDYDLVVVTGDIFEKYSGIKYTSSLLTRKPKLGAFAVLGNHDYYNYSMFNKVVGRVYRKWRTPEEKRDVSPMVKALREVGFTVLQNSAAHLPEHKLHVIGIDWPTIERDELLSLASNVPRDHFSLCLFHLPKNLDNIAEAGVDLAVGGHTHGGQIRVPGIGALITDSELSRHEASGLIVRGKTAFHISRGLGADPRSNIRFFCPPAVTVLNVRHRST